MGNLFRNNIYNRVVETDNKLTLEEDLKEILDNLHNSECNHTMRDLLNDEYVEQIKGAFKIHLENRIKELKQERSDIDIPDFVLIMYTLRTYNDS